MIARVRKSMDENQKGFTLIELLVVVIIIGILAAIAIPMFLSQREKAWEKQVVSDLKNAATAAEAFATDENGTYDGMDAAALEDNGYRQTDGVTAITVDVTNGNKEYTLTAGHDNLDSRTWTYDSSKGLIEEN